MDKEKIKEAMEGLLEMKKAKELYEHKRIEVAKIAYQCIKKAIEEVESMEHINIRIPWDECVEVDGEMFTYGDFRDEI